jgi:hypothetical protein
MSDPVLTKSAIRRSQSPQMAQLCALLSLLLLACGAQAFEAEDYEEEAGSSFAFLGNPADEIYGMSLGFGTWLKGTPVFGDYFVRLLKNGIEDSVYSGLGMTFRLMPHWRLAPFVGAGGGYDASLSNRAKEDEFQTQPRDPEELPERGESYWGGHVESGVRLWTGNRIRLLELMGRYTWSSLSSDGHDYWLVGISTAAGI